MTSTQLKKLFRYERYILVEAIVYHIIAYDMKYIQGLKFNPENLS